MSHRGQTHFKEPKKKFNNYLCFFSVVRERISQCVGKLIRFAQTKKNKSKRHHLKKYTLNKHGFSLRFLFAVHSKIVSLLQQNHQKQMPTSCFSKASMVSSRLHRVWTLFRDVKIQGVIINFQNFFLPKVIAQQAFSALSVTILLSQCTKTKRITI